MVDQWCQPLALLQAQLAASLETINAPTIHAAVAPFAAPTPAAAATVSANLGLFGHLHRRGVPGVTETLPDAWALAALVRTHSAGTMFVNSLKVGEFELAVKVGKLTSFENCPSLKLFVGDPAAPIPDAFVSKDTVSYLKGGTPEDNQVEVRPVFCSLLTTTRSRCAWCLVQRRRFITALQLQLSGIVTLLARVCRRRTGKRCTVSARTTFRPICPKRTSGSQRVTRQPSKACRCPLLLRHRLDLALSCTDVIWSSHSILFSRSGAHARN